MNPLYLFLNVSLNDFINYHTDEYGIYMEYGTISDEMK